MMTQAQAQAQVISVNPSVKTLGELGGDFSRFEGISRRLTAPGKTSRVSVLMKVVNLFFGLNKKVNAQLSGKLVLLRVICGSLLIAATLVPMSPADILSLNFSISAWAALGVALSLLIGFLSRPMAWTVAGFAGYYFAMSLVSLQPDYTMLAAFMLGFAYAITGPGLFSLDQLTRKGIFTLRRNRLHRIRDKKRRSSLSYDAYGSIERRV